MRKNKITFAATLILAGSLIVFSGCGNKKAPKNSPSSEIKKELKESKKELEKTQKEVKKDVKDLKEDIKDTQKR